MNKKKTIIFCRIMKYFSRKYSFETGEDLRKMRSFLWYAHPVQVGKEGECFRDHFQDVIIFKINLK